ncbi:restriction endonuclease [Bacillus sp. RO1]|uniref:restriction endonuclease n=1 Tax=Bacillus sp. RO1 TaxID=2722703 RepID=UPI001457156D|nr:restriction endonuclease [Bacillus sp. RO1]NLP51291.1 restriction endonuclease [Bacillus sp. RO1]
MLEKYEGILKRIRLLIQKGLSYKCSHGIIGGSNLKICFECIVDSHNSTQLQIKKNKIIIMAREQKDSEIARIREVYLSNEANIRKFKPSQFEHYVGDLFSKFGFENVEVSPPTNDGGKDIVMWKDGKKYYVECKLYKKSTIGRPDIQKFVGAMVSDNVDYGYFINTGKYSEAAHEYAKNFKGKLELIDINKLMILVNKIYNAEGSADYINLICINCGEMNQCRIENGKVTKHCKCKHIIEEDVHIHVNYGYKKRRSNYRGYYRRRYY